ncbi:MAG TPA: type II secretion system major pseudopilin GspG [Verrucomicrobiae bacterium]|nr:type II secretion system major pseudopilin GspG [Verrucomicrobiae bacterium]
MNHTCQRNRSAEAGFTLLEILLVVIIISMLVGVAVVNLAPKVQESKKTAAQDQIHNFASAIDLYFLDSGIYPSSEQGLQALITAPTSTPAPGNWKGPYLTPAVIKKDPWNHDYVYQCPGTHNPTGYDLYSPGPDGVAGNEDDIGNWQ